VYQKSKQLLEQPRAPIAEITKHCVDMKLNQIKDDFSNFTIDLKVDPELLHEVNSVIRELNSGALRSASQDREGEWQVSPVAQKAILAYFRLAELKEFVCGDLRFYDKIPPRQDLSTLGIRVVPHAVVRYGAFIEAGAILMPSYVNIGARVGSGTLVDTWATVGSCAQIGRNCHLSGGVGIGGVLEPIGAKPVIIEDNVFIGARSEVAEGVIVRERAVLSMGIFIGASTKIFDARAESFGKMYQGEVPAGAVVVAGTRTKKIKEIDQDVQLYAPIIVKTRDARTDVKTALTESLR
jgi:2,3,4,5-tetrahydropyridine-2-carboxylate N-succinyltransferase